MKTTQSDFLSFSPLGLVLEGAALGDLARRFGTPLYVYSAGKILSQFAFFDAAFRSEPHTICYALKANGNLSVVRLLAQAGAGADIVSGGELARALKAGVPPSRIVFSGVGKKEEELRAALRAGIFQFNVESLEEAQTLNRVALRMRRRAPLAFRVNPDVAVDTHRHIATGREETKFGVPLVEAGRLYRWAARQPGLKVQGVQAHIGSQLLDVKPYGETARKLVLLSDDLAASGVTLRVLDLGGGLGARYHDETPPTPQGLAEALAPHIRGRGVHLVFEPGRYLVAEAGVLVTRVLYRKATRRKNFLIVDAGMNDLARPALYDAWHPVWPLRPARGPRRRVDVVGPVCETSDTLARDRLLPWLPAGEMLALGVAGAYGFSMSSSYNARPRPAEVLVHAGRVRLIRRRESQEDLWRGEA